MPWGMPYLLQSVAFTATAQLNMVAQLKRFETLNDLNSRNNIGCGASPAYRTTAGWDAVTGLGSPDCKKLIFIKGMARADLSLFITSVKAYLSPYKSIAFLFFL